MSRKPGVWWDKMWNPVTGCTPISPGCKNCWARRQQNRWKKSFVPALFHPERFDAPFHWRKPRIVFVCGFGDLFHDDVPISVHERIYATMRGCPQHKFVLLTKRPAMMAFSLSRFRPLPNVICGVSVCRQKELYRSLIHFDSLHRRLWRTLFCAEPLLDNLWLSANELQLFQQVIVGCESGTKGVRRSMEDAWVRDIRNICEAVKVPFYFKQAVRDGKVVGEPFLDGVRHTDLSGIRDE